MKASDMSPQSISGKYKDLRIHLNALERMIGMRGGFRSLGWHGVLHAFISS